MQLPGRPLAATAATDAAAAADAAALSLAEPTAAAAVAAITATSVWHFGRRVELPPTMPLGARDKGTGTL